MGTAVFVGPVIPSTHVQESARRRPATRVKPSQTGKSPGAGLRPEVVVWGAGSHAEVVSEIIRLEGHYHVIGFLDDVTPERRGEAMVGGTVLGGQEQLERLRARGVERLILAIGDCEARLRLALMAKDAGFHLITAVHPSGIVSDTSSLGDGTVVAAGAIVNPCTTVGDNVIINTGAIVDHHCVVEDGVHLGPGARLAGNVHVERAAFIGIGSVLIDRVRIGANTVVGAGSIVLKDIPKRCVAYGAPAEVVRHRPEADQV